MHPVRSTERTVLLRRVSVFVLTFIGHLVDQLHHFQRLAKLLVLMKTQHGTELAVEGLRQKRLNPRSGMRDRGKGPVLGVSFDSSEAKMLRYTSALRKSAMTSTRVTLTKPVIRGSLR